MEPKQVGASQVALGVAPQGTVLLVRSGSTYYELVLEGLDAMFIPGEWVWTTDKIDARNATVAVILNDTAGTGGTITDQVVGTIAVTAGEVWIISDFRVAAGARPATGRTDYNILVSSIAKTAAGADAAWLEANRAAPNNAYELINIADGWIYTDAGVKDGYIGELGCQLRILGPATITLRLTALVAMAGAETQTTTLTLLGRKVRKVVS